MSDSESVETIGSKKSNNYRKASYVFINAILPVLAAEGYAGLVENIEDLKRRYLEENDKRSGSFADAACSERPDIGKKSNT